MTKRLLLLVCALAALVPAPGGAHEGNCSDRSHTFAKLLQPQDGMAQVQTGPTGAVTVLAGGPVPAVFVSTTGTIEVKIEYACLKSLTLTVTKDGDATPVHTNSWNLGCEHAEKTDQATIGLDAGNYQFQLSGTACNGFPVKGDGRGGFVGDPPLI